MHKEKILILGAGSIGSYLAAKLYKSHYHVDVIGRKAEKIGLQIFINSEKFDFPPTSRHVKDSNIYDFVLLSSKIYDLENNLNFLAKCKFQSKVIILLQNGFFDIYISTKNYITKT
ncbi:2-dehydropantoate 2-reductase [Microbulbifer epialgicus]|uniref:2-dehydropantoate 2-reductase n=1 Tax=Microbulbifer epialgicus TaxID=393907 RepID=A0ABV4P2W7_9GAMM